MVKRVPVPKATQDELLTLCAKRCCLCFGLRADFDEKKGQIAHLDHDPANNDLDNLAFLCFDHHDQYDSQTRLSKGLTLGEVKRYREELYRAVAEMRGARRLAEPGAPARAESETDGTDRIEADGTEVETVSRAFAETHGVAGPRIFLCHAKEDKPRVRELYYQLKAAGYHPWLDEEDLLPGVDWEREIRRAIRGSDIFLACLSQKSLTRKGYIH